VRSTNIYKINDLVNRGEALGWVVVVVVVVVVVEIRLPRYEPHKEALRSVIVDGGSQTKQKLSLQSKDLLCHKARIRASTYGLYNTKAYNLSIEGFCFV
jgi:hypothetical protein